MAASSQYISDGSDVRIKRAQYYVNQKLDELNAKKDLPIRVSFDNDFLQTLPQYDIYGSTDEPVSPHHRGGGGGSGPPRGPLFPSVPSPSWKRLVELDKARQDSQNELPRIRYPPWFYVAIIGAGVAGLRTAMLLQQCGIPYKIFEASKRHGGRVFTYQFPPKVPQEEHNYFDVGAMRFPKNNANRTTFDLVEELQLGPKLIKYVFSQPENIFLFNDIKKKRSVAVSAGDHFDDSPFVPHQYLTKVYEDQWKKTSYGVDACTSAAYDPFREALIDNFDEGWKKLLKYDWASTRSYLTQEAKYPQSVVHWMETRDSGTGGFDKAFSEAVLDSLEFDDPTKEVDWHCFDGGSHVLTDAMLAKLTVKPSYNCRVTSVKQVFRYPHEVVLNLPGRRFWHRFPFMEVTYQNTKTRKTHIEYFGHVVSTVSFAALRTINTESVTMTYKQRQAIRSLSYGPATKVGIKFTSRWWEQGNQKQFGGSSYTDRQSRVVVYPSYGLKDKDVPGVLMATYNWQQDASRYGALIQNHWLSKSKPPKVTPPSETVLLDQIYADLAKLHGVNEGTLRKNTLAYRAFDWYHNPYTMGAFAEFAPGQFNLLYDSIVHTAGYGRFHFAGEVASHHHAWVAGALDSANRVFEEIIRLDFPRCLPKFEKKEFTRSLIFSDGTRADGHFVRGLYSKELEEAASKRSKALEEAARRSKELEEAASKELEETASKELEETARKRSALSITKLGKFR